MKASSAKNILHIGCTNSPATKSRWDRNILLHKHLCDQKRFLGQSIVGLDIDEEAVAWLNMQMPSERLVVGDAHRLDIALPGERFDLIIAGDVIEHLTDPGRFLSSCHGALEPGGTVVLTTINTFGIVRYAKAVFGHEAVHDEHTAYYSISTLKRLAFMIGFSIKKIGYYSLEPHLIRSGLNGFVSSLVDRGLSAIWPQFSEGLIAELSAFDSPSDSKQNQPEAT